MYLGGVHEVIEARFDEILVNVCHQIDASGYADKLHAGVVCCGGGINLKGMDAALAQKPQTSKARLARKAAVQVEWNTTEQPASGMQGVLVGLLMNGDEACCAEYMPEIKPEDEGKAVTGNLFTDDGESAQEERDRKLREEKERKRAEAAKKAEERKEKQKGFLSGIMKRIKTLTDDFEDKVGDFLADEDKDNNQ